MKRDVNLDYAKGFVIILMVIGHCYSSQNILLTLIYAFHMPFFFVVSGMIYGKKSLSTSVIYQPKKFAKNLLVPYFFYDGTLALFLALLNRQIGWKAALKANFITVFTFRGVGACWFLACAFFVETVFLLLYQKMGNKTIGISAVLFLGCLLSSTYLTDYGKIVGRCLIGIGFFAIGFFLRNTERAIKKKHQVLLLTICAGLYIVGAITNGSVSLASLQVGNPFLYVGNALLGTALTLRVIRTISNKSLLRPIFNILQRFGKHTLFIVGSHMFIVEIIRLVDYKIFGNILPTFGLGEGLIFATIVCVFEYLLIPYYVNIKQYLNEKYREFG